ncbi:hypothetical protein PC116_g34616, partial [Phytophthora cactorum]
LEKELAQNVVVEIPDLKLPPLIGGAVGYVGYDCVRYFEPKTARPMKDVLKIPESLFMLFDTIVAFDRFFGVIKVITYLRIPENLDTLEDEYNKATATIYELIDVLNAPEIPIPIQQPIKLGQQYTSNIGQEGYESHVTELKKHIVIGDLIQDSPSQRFARPASVHPLHIDLHRRTVTASP